MTLVESNIIVDPPRDDFICSKPESTLASTAATTDRPSDLEAEPVLSGPRPYNDSCRRRRRFSLVFERLSGESRTQEGQRFRQQLGVLSRHINRFAPILDLHAVRADDHPLVFALLRVQPILQTGLRRFCAIASGEAASVPLL